MCIYQPFVQMIRMEDVEIHEILQYTLAMMGYIQFNGNPENRKS